MLGTIICSRQEFRLGPDWALVPKYTGLLHCQRYQCYSHLRPLSVDFDRWTILLVLEVELRYLLVDRHKYSHRQ